MLDGIPILPHDLSARAQVFIPRPGIVDEQPALWGTADQPKVLPLPAGAGTCVARDAALEWSVGVDFGFGFRPVGASVEGCDKRLIRERLIAGDLIGIGGAARIGVHGRGDLRLSEVPAVKIEDHLPGRHRAEDIGLLAIELEAIVRLAARSIFQNPRRIEAEFVEQSKRARHKKLTDLCYLIEPPFAE